MRSLIGLTLTALLTACGGSSSDTPPAPPATSQAVAVAPKSTSTPPPATLTIAGTYAGGDDSSNQYWSVLITSDGTFIFQVTEYNTAAQGPTPDMCTETTWGVLSAQSDGSYTAPVKTTTTGVCSTSMQTGTLILSAPDNTGTMQASLTESGLAEYSLMPTLNNTYLSQAVFYPF